MTIHFTGQIWQYPGAAGWHFVTLPPGLTADLKALNPPGMKGFGAVAVTVRCQEQVWKTSVFPDSRRGAYVLPFKAEIRKKLGVAAGAEVSLVLDLLG